MRWGAYLRDAGGIIIYCASEGGGWKGQGKEKGGEVIPAFEFLALEQRVPDGLEAAIEELEYELQLFHNVSFGEFTDLPNGFTI